MLAGEVKSKSYLDIQKISRDTINKIGYTKGEYQFDGNSCGVISCIHEQSEDINRGVDRGQIEQQGAGDQGMMFGYANGRNFKLYTSATGVITFDFEGISSIAKRE